MMPQSSPCAPGRRATARPPACRSASSANAPGCRSARARPGTVDTGCSGWMSAKPGQPRQLFVEARVVLHRARAERVEPAVDRVVLLRQPGEVAHDLRLAETRAGRSAPCRSSPPRRLRNGAGSGRSTPQWPGESCSKISGSSICSPRLPLIVSTAGRNRSRRRRAQRLAPLAHRQHLPQALFEPVDVLRGRHLGRRHQQQIRQLVAVRIEAADRDAGEDALCGQRLDDRRRGHAAAAT